MKSKIGNLITILFVCVLALSITGCLWPSQATKDKLDVSLAQVGSDNAACQAGDCNECRAAIAEANSTVNYVKDNPGFSTSAAKAKLKKAAAVTAQYNKRCQDANSCVVAKTGSQKCYLILKWIRSYANGGEGSNE